eukprot:SAG11_NODE_1120_length_5789_cov_12.068190_5_plen_74_part_00
MLRTEFRHQRDYSPFAEQGCGSHQSSLASAAFCLPSLAAASPSAVSLAWQSRCSSRKLFHDAHDFARLQSMAL